MDGGSIDSLELPSGLVPTMEHLRVLDQRMGRNASLRGVRVRRRQFPWGHHDCYDEIGGTGSAPVFQPDVSFDGKGVATIRWNGPQAFIAGLTPVIPLPGADPANAPQFWVPDPQSGELPSFTVTPDQFDPNTGECGVYWKVATSTDGSFVPINVTPAARGIPLTGAFSAEAYTAYKLALVLRMRSGQPSYDEGDDRALFCSQGFIAVNQLPTGIFTPLWWATFSP